MKNHLLLYPLLLLVVTPVLAEFDKRMYLGLSGGMSFIEPNPNDTGYRVEDNADTGLKLTLGWDFAEKWALEGYYSKLGEATLVEDTGFSLTPAGGAVSYQAGGLSAVYYLYNREGDFGYQNREGLSLLAKVGVGVLDTSSETLPIEQVNGAHLMLGIGLEWAFASGLGLRAEIEAYDKDAAYASIGFLWRFGRDSSPGDRSSGEAQYVEARDPEPASTVPQRTVPTPIPQQFDLDTDADGVPDTRDDCIQSESGAAVDETGCAVFDGALEGVNFLSGSAELTGEAKGILDTVASQLQRYASVKIAIMAHTDNAGPATSNIELSKRRAISVAQYLVERGVAPSRLRPEAYGESRPRASNATDEGRRRNRRVELRQL